MKLGLDGRTALVLGSTSGLGWAIARGLGQEGANVVICGRRADLAAARASELPAAKGIEVDLTRPDAAAAAVRAARDRFGEIDILVLNGGGPPPGPAATVHAEDFAGALATLFLVQVELVSLVIDGMRERRWGRILAVGSSGIVQPLPNLVRSNAARAALAGYLKTLAGEVAADGVTVNLVLPGRIDTDRIGELDRNAASRQGISVEEAAARSRATIPAGRYGTPAEFGGVATFLCSEVASYVTGSAIRVDGGLVSAL
jgi:3-oxoacyl-[acyl-carrier protein] reductase